MEYKSNIQTVVTNLQGKLKKAGDVSALQRTIGTYLLASNTRRIHNEGLDIYGKLIGAYSIKPMYVNPRHSPKAFAPMGKYGRVKFKNGRLHKTKYFNTGYLGFRASIGRDFTKMNLQLTGRLKLDWMMSQEGKNFILGFRSQYGTKVSTGNEIKRGTQIWGVSAVDRKKIDEIEIEFINKALAKN